MVQHFMSHVRQQQFLLFCQTKTGFGGLAPQHSALCILARKAKYLSLHSW